MSTATHKRLNLLVVDDSIMMRAMIRRAAVLSNVPLGTIYEASNGEEALALMETTAIDALFTDINMPVMTGLELLRAIDGQDRWRTLLRVIISADGSTSQREQVGQVRACRYVEKPFKPEAIRDVLASLL
ncbi:MAG: response regulator [Vicinamibacterales bacterium]